MMHDLGAETEVPERFAAQDQAPGSIPVKLDCG
jgi:hypothetical protein